MGCYQFGNKQSTGIKSSETKIDRISTKWIQLLTILQNKGGMARGAPSLAAKFSNDSNSINGRGIGG